jgi:hypothetical protein
MLVDPGKHEWGILLVDANPGIVITPDNGTTKQF